MLVFLEFVVGWTSRAGQEWASGECSVWLKSWGTAFLRPACLLSCRPVCGVAGIPSSQSGAQHHLQHSASSAAALPHCSHTGGAGSALAYRAQVDAPPAILMPSSLQAPQPQEQNGILDWLRKLRLHKYYPVFKQLTMEKVRGSCAGCAACQCSSGCPHPDLARRACGVEG